jgi:hypothetical protein
MPSAYPRKVNAAGDTRRVCLDDIYELAEALGTQVTKAEY